MNFKVLAATAALACAAAPALAGANLLTNGSFETGDFTGWTQFGNDEFTGVTGTFASVDPSNGAFHASFGPVESMGGIEQDITTVAGTTYKITFDLFNFGGGPSAFSADFGAANLLSQTDAAGFTYTTLEYKVRATGTATTLAFAFRHDPAYYLLDNVTVSVPEPASWTLMIGGFGLTGAAMRRRKLALAA